MSIAIQRTVTVSAAGTIEVAIPDLPLGGTATIIITVEDNLLPKRSVLDIRELPGHRLFHSVEEVDAYIRGERDSWDDE